MYCPNCGNKNSASQKFCRSCGLGLDKIVSSLAEQVPGKLDQNLQERKDRLEKLGVAALSVFGAGVMSLILYGIVYKLMITQGKLLAGLAALGFLIMVGCGLLSVVLFAKANELKEASSKRQVTEPDELVTPANTRELLTSPQPEPTFSVADRTTDLLLVDRKRK